MLHGPQIRLSRDRLGIAYTALNGRTFHAGDYDYPFPLQSGGGFFSPGLDEHGNSVRGARVCRDLSERFGLHIFADPSEERLGLTIAQWATVDQT